MAPDLPTQSAAFFQDCSFGWRICSSVSSSPSAYVNMNCSSSATSGEDVVTSMGSARSSYRILRWIFSVTFSSNLERKSAAVLIEPVLCAIQKLNCSAQLHAFHKDGGIALIWKKRVTDFLSFKTKFGFDASHRTCAKIKKCHVDCQKNLLSEMTS